MATAPDGLVIEGDQLRERLERSLVVRMPKPVELAQWRVGFCRSPPQISVTVDDVPVVASNDACLVANPADVAVFEQACIREYQCVGLIGAQLFDDMGEVVDVAGAACAVIGATLKCDGGGVAAACGCGGG